MTSSVTWPPSARPPSCTVALHLVHDRQGLIDHRTTGRGRTRLPAGGPVTEMLHQVLARQLRVRPRRSPRPAAAHLSEKKRSPVRLNQRFLLLLTSLLPLRGGGEEESNHGMKVGHWCMGEMRTLRVPANRLRRGGVWALPGVQSVVIGKPSGVASMPVSPGSSPSGGSASCRGCHGMITMGHPAGSRGSGRERGSERGG